MKSKKKSFRKEIKQPDEFVTFWGRTLEYIMQHLRVFISGLVGVLVVVVLISGGVSYMKKKEEKASDLLGKAQALLRNKPPPANMDPMTAEMLPIEPDPEAKDEAVFILEELAGEYGGTHAAQLGRILLGDIYYERGVLDSAIKTYQAFLEGKSEPPALESLAMQGLAYSHEAKGNVSEALNYYEKLSQSEISFAQGWALLGQARCHEKQDQHEKALEAYRKLLADHPHHPKAEEAKANITKISRWREHAEESPPKESEPETGDNP